MYALGFSHWKKRALQACFPECAIRFVASWDDVPLSGSHVAVWGMRPRPLARPDIEIVRIEDGFLRSVGLGADLIQPVSWVVDRCGMYFDATAPSDLELLLNQTVFTPPLLSRAAALRERLLHAELTKYNVGTRPWTRPAGAVRVILVPGQVESDASLAFGAPQTRTNAALLQSVRSENPSAYVLYKPHPDVLAGLRAQGAGEDQASRWCDEVVTDVSMGQLLPHVDEVHVLTSLTGFEALLRGKQVVCYGQPFYAGWGLTLDRVPLARRQRQLTIDELVAGVLILYPRYMPLRGKGLITVEQAVDELVRWKQSTSWLQRCWRRIFRVVLRQWVGVR